jgi:hypothetical protein
MIQFKIIVAGVEKEFRCWEPVPSVLALVSAPLSVALAACSRNLRALAPIKSNFYLGFWHLSRLAAQF